MSRGGGPNDLQRFLPNRTVLQFGAEELHNAAERPGRALHSGGQRRLELTVPRCGCWNSGVKKIPVPASSFYDTTKLSPVEVKTRETEQKIKVPLPTV